MSKYNLSDNVQDNFPFELRDKKYVMRYPRTSEVEEIQVLTTELKEAQDSKNADKITEVSRKMEDFMYGFISPEGHETTIKEALKDENIVVMRNFNTMIRTELSVST